MAFGLFKKQVTADIIFMNGRVYTQNPELPWVEAVAVAGGEVIAIGSTEEIMEDFEDDETEVVDLEGGVMTPGFIDAAGHPVMKCFEEFCFFMDPQWDTEQTIEAFTDHLERNPDIEVGFAYGFNETLFTGLEQDETHAMLDRVSAEIPLIAIAESGVHAWLNTKATQTVRETAEAEEVDQVNLAYIIGVLAPLELDELLEEVLDQAKEYCRAGFTAVFDCGAPDYFLTLYQGALVNMYQEDLFKQRFYGSLLINRNVETRSLTEKLIQNRTNCAELDHIINFNTLKLVVDGTRENGPGIPEEAIESLAIAASERNFNVHADAVGKQAVKDVMEAFDSVRGAGFRKNILILASEERLSEEEKQEYITAEQIITVPSTIGTTSRYAGIEGAGTMEEIVDRLTIEAAEQLGMEEKMGSIEIGKYADFTIFDGDPFKERPSAFGKLGVAMTVVAGIVVYDSEEDEASNWYDLLLEQQY